MFLLGLYQGKCNLVKKGPGAKTHKDKCATHMTNSIGVSASLWRFPQHESNFNTLYSMKGKCRLLKTRVRIGPVISGSYVLVKNVGLTWCAPGVATPNSNIHAITGIGRWTGPINRLLVSQQILTNCWNKYIVLLTVQIVENGYHRLFVIVVLIGSSKRMEFLYYDCHNHSLERFPEIFFKRNFKFQFWCL
jgi:hypothetical protein